jgi:hypothetical protein
MSIKELRALDAAAELIRLHDDNVVTAIVGIQCFLDELTRRDASRVNDSMLKLTRVITVLAVVVTVATLLQIGIAFWK